MSKSKSDDKFCVCGLRLHDFWKCGCGRDNPVWHRARGLKFHINGKVSK